MHFANFVKGFLLVGDLEDGLDSDHQFALADTCHDVEERERRAFGHESLLDERALGGGLVTRNQLRLSVQQHGQLVDTPCVELIHHSFEILRHAVFVVLVVAVQRDEAVKVFSGNQVELVFLRF